MAVITGGRATILGTYAIDQESRVIDMSDSIYMVDPNDAPLTALLMRMPKAKAVNPKFQWLEDDHLPIMTAVTTTNYADTATTITVTAGTGTYFRAGDILKVLDTDETLYVTASSANEINVKRSVGAVAATTINSTSKLVRIGDASKENDTVRTILTTSKTPKYNYTQIFRWPFGASGTLMESELYGGNDMDFQARKAASEHRRTIEMAFWFGEKNEHTSEFGVTDTVLRLTGGFVDFGVAADASTTMSMSTMETFLANGMRYGSSEKVFFVSRTIASYLNIIASNKIQTVPTDESFPLAVKEWVSPHGTIYIVTNNAFVTGNSAGDYPFHGWGCLVDMEAVRYRFLNNRDTKLRTNIQTPSADGRTDEYLTECGLMLITAQRHYWRTTVTNVA